MSMLSSKLDAVSKNSIWEEHVKKETRNLKLNEKFMISDSRKMDILPEKPNRTVPTSNPDKETMAAAEATLKAISSLQDTDKLPTEKFALPLTGNMEYGFFAKQLVRPNPQFDHKIRSCDVTEYATQYTLSQGTNPYARKE